MTEPAVPEVAVPELAARVAQRFRDSAGGSRVELESREEIVEDRGVRFVVRVLSPRWGAAAARAKHAAAAAKASAAAGGAATAAAHAARTSPFLPPYDPQLLIGAISGTHVGILNKYNVLDRHLLIVTRAYEPQETALGAADFEAARLALDGLDGLVFYNSGPDAGASQSHRHLQLVPFPIGPRGERFPLDRLVESTLAAGLDRLAPLGCRHRVARLGGDAPFDLYRDLIARFGLDSGRAGGVLAPYNLLLTREWIALVPRSRAEDGSIEVNALGFAGAMVARGEEELAMLRATGGFEALRRVGVAW
jgi:ATP adenylyltransferase